MPTVNVTLPLSGPAAGRVLSINTGATEAVAGGGDVVVGGVSVGGVPVPVAGVVTGAGLAAGVIALRVAAHAACESATQATCGRSERIWRSAVAWPASTGASCSPVR